MFSMAQADGTDSCKIWHPKWLTILLQNVHQSFKVSCGHGLVGGDTKGSLFPISLLKVILRRDSSNASLALCQHAVQLGFLPFTCDGVWHFTIYWRKKIYHWKIARDMYELSKYSQTYKMIDNKDHMYTALLWSELQQQKQMEEEMVVKGDTQLLGGQERGQCWQPQRWSLYKATGGCAFQTLRPQKEKERLQFVSYQI